MLSCSKNTDSVPIQDKPLFEKFSWTDAIDSLKGQYFQGINNSTSSELYVNLWNRWPNGNATQEPITLISYDNGSSWKTISDKSGLPRTWTYVQRHGGKIFAGTPDKGLFISNDNGLTWQPSVNSNWVWPEVIKSSDRNLIISDFRLDKTFLSYDNGLTWKLIYPSFLKFINISQSNLLVFNRGTVLESSDWGSTWTTDNSLKILLGENEISLGITKRADTLIAAVQKGVYIKKSSTNESWKKISIPIEKELGLFVEIDGKIIIQEQFTNNLFYSADNGNSWKNFGSMRGRLWNIVKSGKYLFASGEFGLFKRQIAD